MANTILTSREIDAWTDDNGLSDEFLEILSEPDTNDGIVVLMRISHPDLLDPIRVSSNPGIFLFFHPDTREPVHGTMFGGEQYLWCAFSFVLVNDPETGAMGGASVSIENIDPIMTTTLREIDTAPQIDIALLRKNDTSKAEMIIDYLKVTNATINYGVIQGELTDYNFLAEPVSPDKFTPASFPGLF